MTAYFIAIEGPDGSGKTTIAKLLEKDLGAIGHEVYLTREPGGTPIGEAIRDILLDVKNTKLSPRTEALLYAGARAQVLDELIRPKLSQGHIVISDRFVHSSLAYQGHGRDLGIEEVMDLNGFALGQTYPDRIVFFDIDPSQGLKRNHEASKQDRLELEDKDFHKKVYEGYKKALKTYSKNVKYVDASQTIEDLHQDVLNIVLEDLNEINNSHNPR